METRVSSRWNITYADGFPEVQSLNMFGIMYYYMAFDASALELSGRQATNANWTYSKDQKYPDRIDVLRDNYDYENINLYGFFK